MATGLFLRGEPYERLNAVLFFLICPSIFHCVYKTGSTILKRALKPPLIFTELAL